MEIPWRCSQCATENWIDPERLSERPLDNLLRAQGFVCEHCGAWEAVSHTSNSLRELERKLSRYRPDQRQFGHILARLVRKQAGLNARGAAHGAIQHSDLVIAG